MPGPTKRQEKGPVIEKILENSSKPWYLQTPQRTDSNNHDSAAESKAADTKLLGPKETTLFRNHEGAYMAVKRPVVEEMDEPAEAVASRHTTKQHSKQHSKQLSLFELLEQEEEKVSKLDSHRTTERQSNRQSGHDAISSQRSRHSQRQQEMPESLHEQLEL